MILKPVSTGQNRPYLTAQLSRVKVETQKQTMSKRRSELPSVVCTFSAGERVVLKLVNIALLTFT